MLGYGLSLSLGNSAVQYCARKISDTVRSFRFCVRAYDAVSSCTQLSTFRRKRAAQIFKTGDGSNRFLQHAASPLFNIMFTRTRHRMLFCVHWSLSMGTAECVHFIISLHWLSSHSKACIRHVFTVRFHPAVQTVVFPQVLKFPVGCRLGMRHCYCAHGHDKTYTLCNRAFLPKNNENMRQLVFLWRWLCGYGVF